MGGRQAVRPRTLDPVSKVRILPAQPAFRFLNSQEIAMAAVQTTAASSELRQPMEVCSGFGGGRKNGSRGLSKVAQRNPLREGQSKAFKVLS